jgi:hypothetical protein
MYSYGYHHLKTSVVGDIAPREGISKAEKRKLEAVSLISSFISVSDLHRRSGSDAQFCTRDATRQPCGAEDQNAVGCQLGDDFAA